MKPQVLVSVLCLLALSACYRQPDFNQLSSNFVVSTNVDKTVDFHQFKTYYISDTISLVASDSKDTILYDNTAQQLVAAVKQNMDSRGFTLVGKGSNPDLGFNMGVIKNISAGTIIYPGWWWGYPGWWYPWDYPYYYPWSVTYIVTTGSIVIDLMDLKNAAEDHKLKVVWTNVSAGALGSNYSANLQYGINAINQAFTQTPTLTTK